MTSGIILKGAYHVEIPVENVKPGTVAVIVKADGTEEIVKTSTIGKNGVVLTLGAGATVKLVDNAKPMNDVKDGDWYADLTKRYGGVKVWQSYDWYTDYGMDQLYGGTVMKLIGNLKKQVEKAESKQEKKSLIENAGMLLSDDELESVAGGKSNLFKPYEIYCAGVVARNGKVITPGCHFKETHHSYDSAIQKMTKIYKNKCPRCKIHPLALREI